MFIRVICYGFQFFFRRSTFLELLQFRPRRRWKISNRDCCIGFLHAFYTLAAPPVALPARSKRWRSKHCE